jgi:uncharacterized protein (DUF983 family)
MIRFATSFLASFVLVYIQSVIVMKWNGYSSIQFDNMLHLTIVWIMNFFLSFSILTHLKPWLIKTQGVQESMEENNDSYL